MTGAVVRELAIAVLKGGRLSHPEHMHLTRDGIADDRRFFVVAEDGRQYDARRGALTAIAPEWDPHARRLVLRFPDGEADGVVSLGERADGLVTWDRNRPVPGREVLGPWSAALSEHLGERVRLVERVMRPAVDVAPVTVVSLASVARLESEMGLAGLGARRFRMTMTLDGIAAHEEDGWQGADARVGDCELTIGEPVPRCVAVTHDPASGERDHPVLKGIVGYRRSSRTEGGSRINAPFGMYAFVKRPGPISVGDRVLVRVQAGTGL